MTQHDDQARLRHMLDHARETVQLARDRARPDLDQDRLFSLAMTRLLEIIGEAAGRVTQATRDQHPQIPWSQMVGLRNRLIHGYDEVDFDILWTILQSDLPPLILQIELIVGKSEWKGNSRKP